MENMVARAVFFSKYPQAFFALVRTCGRRHTGSCAALALLVLATTATASGQSLVVTSGGSTVSQGNTLSITTVPSMPSIVLSVNGGTSCDSVSYAVSVSYTDQAGQQTSATYVADNIQGDQSVTVSWAGSWRVAPSQFRGSLTASTKAPHWAFSSTELTPHRAPSMPTLPADLGLSAI